MKLFKPAWISHDGHPIFSIDINPDDTHFATGGQGEDNTGRVVIWNLKAVAVTNGQHDSSIPKRFCQLDHHNACVNIVRWSHSGHQLASGGDDKVIIIWKLISRNSGNNQSFGSSVFEKNNLEIWKTVCILRGHVGDVLDLAWSPGDTYLASCSIDNSIKIWNAQAFPQVIATLDGHTSMVKGVTWDPVGKYLATQSVDKTLRIWRTVDWMEDHLIKDPFIECGGTTHVLRLAWSPDGLYLVSAHAMNAGFPTAQIVERDGWKVDKDFVGHRKAVVCVRFCKNIRENNRAKQCLVALGSRDKSISVWSTALKRPVVVVKDAFTHSVMDLTWSHSGNIMMACSSDGTVMAAQFSEIEIGRPLTMEETDAVFQRCYGNTKLSVNTANVIPNMEVYLARKELEAGRASLPAQHVATKASPSRPEKDVQRTTAVTVNNVVDSVKGPTKQIETRTADGKRRITPKFLPLLTEDNMSAKTSSFNTQPAAFQKPEEDVVTPKNSDFREKMVSRIDNISFPENHQQHNFKNENFGAEKANAVLISAPTCNEKSPDKPVINGFHNPSQTTDNSVPKENGLKASSLDSSTSAPVPSNPVSIGKGTYGEGKQEAEPMIVDSSGAQEENVGSVSSHTVNQKAHETAKPDQPPQVNMIQVKRKRPPEDQNSSPILAPAKKKLLSSKFLSGKKLKSESISNTTSEPPATSNRAANVCTKVTCSVKSHLPPLKIESGFTIKINPRKDVEYSLEVLNNFTKSNAVCHLLKCNHLPNSMQGLEWVVCTDAPFCAISGDSTRIIGLCEDATCHVFDLKGRYALSPILLSGYPSKCLLNGQYLLVVTTKAILHLWDIYSKSTLIKEESLLPMLQQPNSVAGDAVVDIAHVYIAQGGIPVIYLSTGKAFIFNKEMCSWMLFSDPRGLVSRPLMPSVSDANSFSNISKLVGNHRRPDVAILSHIKLQFIKAIELRKPDAIRQWILAWAKTMANQGLEKELHLLCEDLLGPAHASSSGSSSSALASKWRPTIADCVNKRELLRLILNNLVEDLRWQEFFCEFDELLKETPDPS